jgi:integral membrane protein
MPPTETTARTDERNQLRRMRLVSLLEGATLVALLFVAVPLKHVAGHPAATSIVGPIHGMAFLLYVWMLIQTVSGADWSRAEIARAVIVAFIPFGAFANERFLRRKELALAGSVSPERKWDTSG